MRPIDILLLIFLTWGGYRGFQKGLIWEIFSTGALALATLGSMRLLGNAVELCTQWFHSQNELLPYVVFVFLFVIILIAITLAGRLFRALIRPTLLGGLDRFLGTLLGIFKWGMYMSTLLWLGSLVQLKIPEVYTENTFLFPIIESLGPQLIAWCSPWIPYIQEWFTTTDTHQES